MKNKDFIMLALLLADEICEAMGEHDYYNPAGWDKYDDEIGVSADGFIDTQKLAARLIELGIATP